MERKFIAGVFVARLEMNFETNMINEKYYKIIKPRLNNMTNVLLGFTSIRCEYVEDRKELIAVDELRNKETKIVTIYKLKETNETPKYIKYELFDYLTKTYKILESDEKII
jgi:hypothetical protein